MTDEEREKVKAKAITMEITGNDLEKATDGANPMRLFFESRKAYDFYKSFQRYLGDTKEGLWERMEKAGLTACDVERLLAFNSGLKLKEKPFMGDIQEQWVKEWICEHRAASHRSAKEIPANILMESRSKKKKRSRGFS